MWASYTRALTESTTSLQPTAVNTVVNFTLSVSSQSSRGTLVIHRIQVAPNIDRDNSGCRQYSEFGFSMKCFLRFGGWDFPSSSWGCSSSTRAANWRRMSPRQSRQDWCQLSIHPARHQNFPEHQECKAPSEPAMTADRRRPWNRPHRNR